MYVLFLLPLLVAVLAVLWIVFRWLLKRDGKLFGAALGIVLTAPLVLSFVSYAEFAWLWAREGIGYLMAAYAIQTAGAAVGAKLQKDRERRERSGGRGDRDPAYHYIDQ